MRGAVTIVKNELRSLFVSPVAWAMVVIFSIQTSVVFLGRLTQVTRWQFEGSGPSFSHYVFVGTYGLFDNIYSNLMYYIPLLTMGLISRENQNGSIKLLMSSPITLWHLIGGKYVAITLYLLTFIGFVGGLILFSYTVVDSLNLSYVLSGLLGMFLLAATYAALGLFMSSLTTQQTVAAIATIAVLALLNLIGRVGQEVPVISEVAYWLSMSGRAELMRRGLISTKDVLYFLSIIFLFLTFTYLKLASGRRIEPAWWHGVRYAAVVALVVIFGIVTSLPSTTLYLDATRVRLQSLSEGSVAAVADLDGTLDVTVLVNVLSTRADYFLPAEQNTLYRRLFEQHEREIGWIRVDYQYYYADSENENLYAANPDKNNEELAREFARQNGLNFESFLSQAAVDTQYGLGKYDEYRNVYVFEWQGQTSIVQNYDDTDYYPSEPSISAGIRRLIIEPRHIAYVAGHEERRLFRAGASDHHLHVSNAGERIALLNHGFDVEEITLEVPIPEHVDILVLAAPTEELSTRALSNLDYYLKKGGDMLMLAEPGSANVLNPVSQELGVTILDDQVAQTQPTGMFPESLINAPFSEEASKLLLSRLFWRWEGAPVILPGAVALKVAPVGDFNATPLLQFADTMSLEGPAEPDALAVALERAVRGNTQRIVVVGDADFMSNVMRNISEPWRRSNPEFVEYVFGYLADWDFPIDIRRPAHKDTYVSLDLKDVDALRWVFFGVVPGILFLSGLGVLVLRRRY